MPTVDIGIRIDPEKGLAYFGVDEVNRAIAAGARVVEVRPGGVVMNQVGNDGENVTLTLGGCQLQIVLGDD